MAPINVPKIPMPYGVICPIGGKNLNKKHNANTGHNRSGPSIVIVSQYLISHHIQYMRPPTILSASQITNKNLNNVRRMSKKFQKDSGSS